MERYVICKDKGGRRWYLVWNILAKEPEWECEAVRGHYGIVVYSDRAAAENLMREIGEGAYILTITL